MYIKYKITSVFYDDSVCLIQLDGLKRVYRYMGKKVYIVLGAAFLVIEHLGKRNMEFLKSRIHLFSTAIHVIKARNHGIKA